MNNELLALISAFDNPHDWASLVDTLAYFFMEKAKTAYQIPARDMRRPLGRPIVYNVFYQGERVYIGSSASGDRLVQHYKKLSQALLIDLDAVEFRYVDCFIPALALLIEKRLIDICDAPWQSSGFGRRPGEDNREDGQNAWGRQYGYSGYSTKTKRMKEIA